ncbi:AmmeMemoRadiSam system radical SAM enzyme [Vibrio sp. HN007]|uniref:AmmeMemoRadiSam system radical SAM enzyme n=1 Tax=Vibrio iocasae TaxID=3098914 RepID=UPI0035D47A6B
MSFTHGTVKTRYWHRLNDGRVVCDLCPRECSLRDGKRGACFVRQAIDGEIVLTSYGRSSGFAIDPIEKKPLNHFYPGSKVLSFGTAGCNLGCKFCQNWNISKSRKMDTIAMEASPEQIAKIAAYEECKSVAFTYNDPVIFMEYAVDTAIACHELGIKSVAVSAGYISTEPRVEFYKHMDAANIDLKAFTERFYRKMCSGHLTPVLETLQYLKHETDVWLEVTTLLIPGENDSDSELEAMCLWIYENLGSDVPLHFSAYHPDFKIVDIPRTPLQTLLKARKIALGQGINHVYIGNAIDPESESTLCPGCKRKVIERERYFVKNNRVTKQGKCPFCDTSIPGHFDS